MAKNTPQSGRRPLTVQIIPELVDNLTELCQAEGVASGVVLALFVAPQVESALQQWLDLGPKGRRRFLDKAVGVKKRRPDRGAAHC